MNCIKCGVNVPENQVFCDACLSVMDKYPVKPDITVTLPQRNEIPVSKKKSRRQRTLPPEPVRPDTSGGNSCLSPDRAESARRA